MGMESSKKAAELILCALDDVSVKHGISAKKLGKLISREYNASDRCRKLIPAILKRGIALGAIEKRGSKYGCSKLSLGIRQNRRRRRRSRSRRRSRRGRRRRRRSRRRRSSTSAE